MKLLKLVAAMAVVAMAFSCGKAYESVSGDPIKAQIYTLDNGLKVYMAVNHEEPRIQTYIAVRVGGKNDPADKTGLAHYLEHIMFKGTPNFGTSDFEAEAPLLAEISDLFELYSNTVDPVERKAIYHQIDSVSYEASKYSIPNEYDKLMAAIGAEGTNAHTSFDETVYQEDIPANQIENWARVQSDRFKNMTIRGFHTELEAVYEEKNRSLTSDSRKVYEAILAALYPNHPYGQQSVIGTQEHLKNPSIKTVQAYFDKWYVPNNMAICVSGDFNPKEMIAIIKKYFGDMQSKEVPEFTYPNEASIEAPIVKDVYGRDAQNVALAWRVPGMKDGEHIVGDIVGDILYNGQAGLIDLNVAQKQKTLRAYGYNSTMKDYGMMYLAGTPKAEQTLEQVKDILLEQVALLRNGDFSDELLEAIVNNTKLQYQQNFDSNVGRASALYDSFINETPWKETVDYVKNLGKVTRQDIIDFANKYLGEANYTVVYKHEGADPNEKKIEKPAITPILTNRDKESQFVADVRTSQVKPIEPVFVNFDTDMSKAEAKSGIQVLYKENETTDIFQLSYVFETGTVDNPLYDLAFRYLDYLGTSTKTAEQIKQAFYDIACSYNLQSGTNRMYFVVSGLSENMTKAMQLIEELIADAQPDEAVLANVKGDMFKNRANAKLAQARNVSALTRWATFGEEYIKKTILTDEQIQNVTSEQLLSLVKEILNYQHIALYYGPQSVKAVVGAINETHNVAEELAPLNITRYAPQLTTDNSVLIVHYPAAQLNYYQLSVDGRLFDAANDANIRLFNEYFGGSMNSIVFQEIREARGLAYSSGARLSEPDYAGVPYRFYASAGTQTDKMTAVIDAFADIINDMPTSEKAFAVAKDAVLNQIRTARTIKSAVLWAYLDALDMGVDYDRDKAVFEKVQTMTLDDVVAFQKEWIAHRKYTYCLVGNTADFAMARLNALGKVTTLSQEQVFGY